MVFDQLTLALVVAAITAVVLVSALAVPMPSSILPFISLDVLSESLASPALECTGQGATRFYTFDSSRGEAPPSTRLNSLNLEAAAGYLASFAAVLDNNGNPIPNEVASVQPEITVRVYTDRNGDGLIDCAIVDVDITIRYPIWGNVGTLSQCVQNEWNRYMDIVIEHERRHVTDATLTYANAHRKLVGITSDMIDGELAELEKEWNRLLEQTHRLYGASPRLNKCCSGATFFDEPLDPQPGVCKCNAAGATYNEQGGTVNNPNGGCECPSDQDLHLGVFCIPKCTGGQIHTGLSGQCRCPFGYELRDGQCQRPMFEGAVPVPSCNPPCDTSRNLQCINGTCECPSGWRLINGYCRPPQTCGPCANNSECPQGTVCVTGNGDTYPRCYPYYSETIAGGTDCKDEQGRGPWSTACYGLIPSFNSPSGQDVCYRPFSESNSGFAGCTDDCP